MDSTTIKMMSDVGRNNQLAFKMHADSIQAAVNARAEYLILRHDIVLLLMVSIPSIALVIAVIIYVQGKQNRA